MAYLYAAHDEMSSHFPKHKHYYCKCASVVNDYTTGLLRNSAAGISHKGYKFNVDGRTCRLVDLLHTTHFHIVNLFSLLSSLSFPALSKLGRARPCAKTKRRNKIKQYSLSPCAFILPSTSKFINKTGTRSFRKHTTNFPWSRTKNATHTSYQHPTNALKQTRTANA